MIDPERNLPSLAPRVSEAARPRTPAQSDATRASAGAAFQALLEKLQAQAARLGQDSQRIERPAELAQAVEEAQNSLRDVLALEHELLEAFRQARGEGAGPGAKP